jgi:hypothetical protein
VGALRVSRLRTARVPGGARPPLERALPQWPAASDRVARPPLGARDDARQLRVPALVRARASRGLGREPQTRLPAVPGGGPHAEAKEAEGASERHAARAPSPARALTPTSAALPGPGPYSTRCSSGPEPASHRIPGVQRARPLAPIRECAKDLCQGAALVLTLAFQLLPYRAVEVRSAYS